MNSPWTQVNRRSARDDRRRQFSRAMSTALPWFCFAMALLMLANMVLETAVAIHPLTEQAEALRGM